MSFFFFSSRRRHTRLQGDWSSDVCSSDLSWGPEGRCAAGEGLGLFLCRHSRSSDFAGHFVANQVCCFLFYQRRAEGRDASVMALRCAHEEHGGGPRGKPGGSWPNSDSRVRPHRRRGRRSVPPCRKSRRSSCWSAKWKSSIGRACWKRCKARCMPWPTRYVRSEEHTSELQSPCNLVCRLLLEKKKKNDERCRSS